MTQNWELKGSPVHPDMCVCAFWLADASPLTLPLPTHLLYCRCLLLQERGAPLRSASIGPWRNQLPQQVRRERGCCVGDCCVATISVQRQG